MYILDLISKFNETAKDRTIISVYRKGDGLICKAPAKSPLLRASELHSEILSIEFDIADYVDYDVEMELIIK